MVVIGRNEGERLERCLKSLSAQARCVVYVDSGSSDQSVALARKSAGAVLELDMSRPFTAARARNEGFQKLCESWPSLEYVFFVDGDCEVVDGWLDKACRFLDEHPGVAVVWGIRRERYPSRSVYNLLCDMEWRDAPVGETKACGGDAVIRVQAFEQVKGYRADLICGEEPEMCVRLRQAGWRIWHVEDAMTVHDAAMVRFGQWWRRMIRGGFAYAQGAALHGAPPERHRIFESRRVWLWGMGIPIAIGLLTLVFGWPALLLLLIYPLQVLRLTLRGTQPSARENAWRALALVAGKFPEALGQAKFTFDRWRRAESKLIEYK